MKKPQVRGEVTMVQLDKLQPNAWNPNKMAEHKIEAVRRGFLSVGWLAAQPLLVWGTDETGARRDTIIDGEHRWLCALDVGFVEGPAVVLDGLTEREAKQLTVLLDNTRGEFDRDKLAAVVGELGLPAIDLGFLEQEMADLRTRAAEQLKAAGDAAAEQMAKLEQQAAEAAAAEAATEKQRQADHRRRKEAEHVAPKATYSVLIECEDEADQREKLAECLGKGWSCRALI